MTRAVSDATSPGGFVRVDRCDLCRAARLTPWYHEDEICWIAECEICEVPMVVWRWHGVTPPADHVEHMRTHLGEVHRHWKDFVALGLFAALTTVSQGIAYTLTLSSYVEALKQVEILLAMGIGTLAFGEKQTAREIAPGALVMLGGMVLVSLAG